MEVSKRHWRAKTYGDKCVNVLMVLVIVPTEVGLEPIRTHAMIQASTEQVISDLLLRCASFTSPSQRARGWHWEFIRLR